jgi:hypothetical protein
LVREEHWQRLATGIYLTAAGTPDWTALVWAGVLVGGDRAGVGGVAAGHLHGLVNTPPAAITILLPHEIRRQDQPPWVFSRRRSDDRLRFRGSPPRAGVEETVLDLCADGAADEVATWLTTAVQSRRTTAGRLLTALADRPRQRHRALITSLLDDVAAGAQSFLELRYLNDVERPHGLPRGRRQVRSRDGRSIRDVLYDEYDLVVELDGRLGHEGLGRFRDMWRDNLAALDALLTLRATGAPTSAGDRARSRGRSVPRWPLGAGTAFSPDAPAAAWCPTRYWGSSAPETGAELPQPRPGARERGA